MQEILFVLPTGPPRFLGKPQSLKVKAGGIASFFCSASGSPPPQIHWRKNGRKITQTQSRFMVHPYDNGTLLRIEPVRTGRDSIEYECLAENGVGDAVTATATLTVHEVSSSTVDVASLTPKQVNFISDDIRKVDDHDNILLKF
ncbi:hypothetical protein TKK_0011512 [Trichogramma kaykai]